MLDFDWDKLSRNLSSTNFLDKNSSGDVIVNLAGRTATLTEEQKSQIGDILLDYFARIGLSA